LSSADIFSDKGSSSDADVLTFDAKNFGFFEIYVVYARTKRERRLSQQIKGVGD